MLTRLVPVNLALAGRFAQRREAVERPQPRGPLRLGRRDALGLIENRRGLLRRQTHHVVARIAQDLQIARVPLRLIQSRSIARVDAASSSTGSSRA